MSDAEKGLGKPEYVSLYRDRSPLPDGAEQTTECRAIRTGTGLCQHCFCIRDGPRRLIPVFQTRTDIQSSLHLQKRVIVQARARGWNCGRIHIHTLIRGGACATLFVPSLCCALVDFCVLYGVCDDIWICGKKPICVGMPSNCPAVSQRSSQSGY